MKHALLLENCVDNEGKSKHIKLLKTDIHCTVRAQTCYYNMVWKILERKVSHGKQLLFLKGF